MARDKTKKLVNFEMELELFKAFSKRCIDENTSKTEILNKLIKEWTKK